MPMLDPIIIALTGPAGAGKDTVADYQLVNNHSITHLHKQVHALLAKINTVQEAA